MSQTKVPLLDLTRLDPQVRAELHDAFERVLESGRYIMGPEVLSFEAECAEYVGAEEAIGVSSGSDALLASLMALGIGPGDEVVCPTFTFFATAGSVWRSGAKPVFVDSEPRSLCIDPRSIEACITENTKAIIPVHLFGQCADMSQVLAVAQGHGIPVIEDAAQAIGARHGDCCAGAMGISGCFSFFPSKNLGCLGDGGLITTNDQPLAERLRIVRDHGMKPKYHHDHVGGNFRLDALQAAFLRVKLRWLDRHVEMRRENAAAYDELFAQAGIVADQGDPNSEVVSAIDPGKIGLPVRTGKGHTYNQYVIRVPAGGRDELKAHLEAEGIATEIYYPVPLHMQKAFKSIGHGEFPVAEKAAGEVLALPIFPELTRKEIDHVADQVVAWSVSKGHR
ncbi:MAG: DegT/DnrJ/EryC1/StrS family aminotransferase [Planctomycetota bacterium]|nr:DegT/DnrJ/EryC1/StrS family aminotransferase [Planctomycetota bacterium]